MTSTYGKKGGTGATAGRKLTKYTAQAPDGSKLTKGTYFCAAGTAVMIAYQHGGKWYANSVYPENDLPDWASDRTQLAAVKA